MITRLYVVLYAVSDDGHTPHGRPCPFVAAYLFQLILCVVTGINQQLFVVVSICEYGLAKE